MRKAGIAKISRGLEDGETFSKICAKFRSFGINHVRRVAPLPKGPLHIDG
jgi:hypothetical protein